MLLIVFAAPNLGFAAVGEDALLGAPENCHGEGEWLNPKFSEESEPPHSPNGGSYGGFNVPLTAIKCTGDYCDNMQVKQSTRLWHKSIYGKGSTYTSSGGEPAMISPSSPTGWINTNTYPKFMQCGANEFVKDITCYNAFCGSLAISCHSVYTTTNTSNPERSAIELFGQTKEGIDCLEETKCPDGYVIVGLGCRYNMNCGHPYLICKQAKFRLTVDRAVWLYDYMGNQEVEIDTKIVMSTALSRTKSQTTTSASEMAESLTYGATISAGYGPVEVSASVEKGTSSSSSRSLTNSLQTAWSTVSEQTTETKRTLNPDVDCCPKTGCGLILPTYYRLRWILYDSFGETSTIETDEYLCSNSIAGDPKCLPKDCWGISTIEQGEVRAGCQCCKPDSIVYGEMTRLSVDGIKDEAGKLC
jgi:hypothetical protein